MKVFGCIVAKRENHGMYDLYLSRYRQIPSLNISYTNFFTRLTVGLWHRQAKHGPDVKRKSIQKKILI